MAILRIHRYRQIEIGRSMADDLSENYALYDGRLGFGAKPALILVDFVQAY